MVRSILKRLILSSRISQRTIFGSKIVFLSKEHLNLFFRIPYEKEVWGNISNKVSLSPEDKILDIGANIGQAMLALHRIFPKNEIDCFEPQLKEFSFLQINRIVNGVPGRSYNLALTSKNVKSVNFELDSETGGRMSSVVSSSTQNTIVVNADLLETYITQNVRLIKVDIEGYEAELFLDYNNEYSTISWIIEVRESTSEHITRFFNNTHDIYHLEEQRMVLSPCQLGFCNLLITPKT
jgi:FkbM family methyltransferase